VVGMIDLNLSETETKDLMEGKVNSVTWYQKGRPPVGDYTVINDRMYRILGYGRSNFERSIDLGFMGMYGDEKRMIDNEQSKIIHVNCFGCGKKMTILCNATAQVVAVRCPECAERYDRVCRNPDGDDVCDW